MILDTLRAKCQRKTPEVMHSAVIGVNIFPWDVPLSKSHLNDDLSLWISEVESLKKIDKNNTGIGPRIQYIEKNSRRFGKQYFPSKITFESELDFLNFTSNEEECSYVRIQSSKLRESIPNIEMWLRKPSSFKRILEYKDKWEYLVEVCQYFLHREGKDATFAREAPLKASTKFIEENTGILKELLNVILPPEKINADASDFFERFMLKKDSFRVRFRVLDDKVKEHFFGSTYMSDLELPENELDELFNSRPLHALKVFVVENLTTFLTFPDQPNSIVIFGGGYSLAALQLSALKSLSLFYWGDLDVQGLEILSTFRASYSHVQAILMDEKTLEYHHNICIPGEPSKFSTSPRYLHENEVLIYNKLKQDNRRLEQEKISASHVQSTLIYIDQLASPTHTFTGHMKSVQEKSEENMYGIIKKL